MHSAFRRLGSLLAVQALTQKNVKEVFDAAIRAVLNPPGRKPPVRKQKVCLLL
jgi:hypothetical protein